MTKKISKISIITPSFNQAKFLIKTIESVASQDGDFKIEHIVMDGGSTDESVQVLQEYEKQLKNSDKVTFIWKSEKDKGQSDAINKGLKLATGDLIAYLNSDDTYCDYAFINVIKAFESNPNGLWASGYCHIIDENDHLIQPSITRYKNLWLNHYSYKTLLVLNYICQPATFWKKEVVDKIGLFNEDYHYTMDYDYWLRIGKDNPLVVVNKYLANFRIHGTSKGKTAYIKQFDQDFEVAQIYSTSKLINTLHRFHNSLIRAVYKITK